MNFVVSSSTLLKHLKAIGGVLNTSNTIPILDCFLFEVANGTLTVSASDMETTITTSLKVETTPSVIVSAIPIIVTTPTYTNPTSNFDPLLYCGIVTGINEMENNVGVSVYPNPSNGIINLEINNEIEGLIVKVSDAIGQTLMEKNIDSQNSSINIGNLPDGVYLLSVSGKNGVFTKKIVLQK